MGSENPTSQFVRVSSLVRRKPVYVKPLASIREAVSVMYGENVGSVLVVDENGTLVGIFTERDLVRVVALGVPLDTPIDQVMTKSPVFVHPDASLREVVELMAEKRVRHIPVVDEARRPLGVVSVRDIVDIM